MKVSGVNHITLNVKNLETSINFYIQILGMKLRHKGNKDAYLEWGNAWICIMEKPGFNEVDQKRFGLNHLAFYIAENHFNEAVNVLKENDVSIVREPMKRGVGWSVNFIDPNGIEFELHTSTLDERMKVWK